MFSETKEIDSEFYPPTDEELDKALEGLPVIISNSIDEKTSVASRKLTLLVLGRIAKQIFVIQYSF